MICRYYVLLFFYNCKFPCPLQMKLKLDSKILDTPNTPTSCFIHSKGLNNRNRAKIIPVANKAFETEVYCEKVSMPSNVYEAGIIYGNFFYINQWM